MTAFSAHTSSVITSDDRVLHAAVAAYLGRYRGQSRLHTTSDLKVFLAWRTDQGLDPLRVGRADIERYVRCCRKPATTSPRQSPGGCPWWSASTGPASSTRSCRTRRPTTFVDTG